MIKAKYSTNQFFIHHDCSWFPNEVNTVTNVGNIVDFVYFQVALYLYAIT